MIGESLMSLPENCVRRCVKLIIFVSVPLLVLPSCKANHYSPKNAYKVVRVDVHPENSKTTNYGDIDAAINSATQGTQIVFAAGTYVVNNPLVMKSNGVRVIGAGRERTILLPRNVGKPIFVFQADHLGVEDIGMNAETEDHTGRATFAILIEEGYGNCEIRNTRIQNMAASSIIGPSVNDCVIDNNVIINSGDDAVQLRGPRLKVVNNRLIKYFDEGVDIARGQNTIVGNNITGQGRIGITVADSKNALIYGNIVEDHFHEGMALGSEQSGVVENNIVRDSIGVAYNLYSPLMVRSNVVAGKNAFGFRIRGMKGGIVQQNVIVGADFGIDISASTRNIIYANEYIGKGEFIKSDKDSANTLYGNVATYEDSGKLAERGLVIAGAPIVAMPSSQWKEDRVRSYAEYQKLAKSVRLVYSSSSKTASGVGVESIAVEGETEQDKTHAGNVATFLSKNNPGYLSVQIRGNSMESGITQDLYHSLRGGGPLAIGLVRMPFRIFARDTRSYFPLWHLFVGNREVAVVSRAKSTDAQLQIYFIEDGGLNFRNTLSLWKNRVLAGVSSIKNKSLKRLKSKLAKVSSWR